MFANTPRTEIIIRILLTVVLLIGALSPTSARAQQPTAQDPQPTPTQTASETPTTEPTATQAVTETPTIEADATPSETLPPVESSTIAGRTETAASTPTPSGTPIPTQTTTSSTKLSDISVMLFATPNQAKAGAQVSFTLKVENLGASNLTGLHFSNILPTGFIYVPGDNTNFVFNPISGELAWTGEKDTTLLAGESLTVEYDVLVVSPATTSQILDTAFLTANELDEPLGLEASIVILASEDSLTMLDSRGGEALGLDGQIRVNLPQDSLESDAAVSIRDLRQEIPPKTDEEPWLVFELGLYQPKEEEAESLSLGTSDESDRAIPLEKIEAAFEKTVQLTVSLDGLVDLKTLGADQTPFLVTLDETSGTWLRFPLDEVDREANTISTELTHFSTWGVGVGSSFPDGANILLYNNAYNSLFTGRSSYSIPIWTPRGRNGMAPALSLSYTGSTADGVLGDIQAPWVGMGWNVDSVEIARKITNGDCDPCGGGSYGYENEFLLLFNGTGYELIPDGTTAGRYHTKLESFLYIQLHNEDLGNNSPAAQNQSEEWWEVVEKNGTRWRLGWNADSEQLAAMKGYPGDATGAWSSLGYAGSATDVVASRWRADQVTDTNGNRMTFEYDEETRTVAGTSASYDRASYLDTIVYTLHTSESPAAGYSVVFVRESRSGDDVPTSQDDWDNWDTERLDYIEVKHGSTVVRTYDLEYDVRSYSDDGESWETTVLTDLEVSGGSTNAPTITFTYTDKSNRANCGSGCQEWVYPRLATVSNGWDATTKYTYDNDDRSSDSWYNWRVEALEVNDGVNTDWMKTVYAYDTPCYDDETEGWCNTSDEGELIGYEETTVTTKDFNGTTTLAVSVHSFHTDEQKAGREYEVEYQNASGTPLSKTSTTFTVVTSGLPTDGYFTYASAVEKYLRTTSLTLVSKTEYEYSSTTGNLTWIKEYDDTPSLYRRTNYEYVTNTSASVWILDTVSRVTLEDSSQAIYSEKRYGYDGSLPGSGSPTKGSLTLSRVVDGSQTIDAKYVYDSTYGYLTDTFLYENYGSIGNQPTGTYLTYSTNYDTTLETYPILSTNPLGHETETDYDYGLGMPISVIDPNDNETTTAYDGLGRVTSITYPGFGSPNIKYTYPTPSGAPLATSAPFAVKTEFWDETASVYRSSWRVFDGLGRVLQTQDPYETSGYLILSDTSYNAQGLTVYQGLPRMLSGTGGSHFAPSWGSVPHSTSTYDALSRITSIAYPDSSQETFSYSGLQTTAIDRNSHQKVQEMDSFERLAKVEEYTGNSTYTLYATTTYEYDVRDLLETVTDDADNETTIGYDGYGRKDSISDPDMGDWSYDYDVFGNLTEQTDARDCVINVEYDDLNRPEEKTYSGSGACNSTPDVYFYYDSTTGGNQGIGRRTSMAYGSDSKTWFYNTLGQVTNVTDTIDSTSYEMDFTFDAFGRPLTQTLPSSETLEFDYNDMGALTSVDGTDTYLSDIHYTASGQVTDQQLGNGLIQQSCYETDTLRLSDLRAYSGSLQSCGTSPSSPKLKLSYAYQPNGNVSQIVDATQNETLNYTYDELNRLETVSGAYSLNYDYETIGNLTERSLIPSSVAAGYYHTCSVMTTGADLCWGRNSSAQLGDGTYTQRSVPNYVSGLTEGVEMPAIGDYHSCALTKDGGVKCWGYNDYGQVGDGTTTERITPVDVSGLTSGVTEIGAGYYHTCALTTGGGVKCWGRNNDAQLGDDTTTNRTTPVDVSGLTSGVIMVATGGYHTCALTTSGGVKCWGDNGYGQLGDGTWTTRKTPVDVSGLTSGVVYISAGKYHTCAVLTGGGVKCWGRNSNGQLGDGTTDHSTTPVNVSGLSSGVSAVTLGAAHTCALLTGGGVKCWGDNGYGQVGDGTTTQRDTPEDVSGLTSGVANVNTSRDHTCAVTTAGELKCWGRNNYYQLGFTSPSYSSSPLTAEFPTTYTYGDTDHVHAVTALNTGETYTYDANGNMTQRVENGETYAQTFDAENRLISVTVDYETTEFVYDGDGTLIKKINDDGSYTIYIGGVYEIDKSSGGTTTRTVTYYPGGAMRIDSTLYYVLKDHLGSASVVTDSSGNIVGEQRYYPFGETRLSTGSIYTDKLFTGQRQMAGLGIYHYGARFYSSKIGRFLSADTIVPNPLNPQDLNRFSYVRNNPLRYIDPSGNMPCDYDETCRSPGLPTPPPPPPPPPPSPSPSPYPTPTPSPTPSPLPSPTPTPSPYPTPSPSTTPSPTTSPPLSTGTPPPFTQASSTQSSQTCSTNPDGCIVGGALLIIFTDLFVGLPAFVVIVFSGGATPPAIAAEALETFVVLPVNIYGVYLIAQGLEAKRNEE